MNRSKPFKLVFHVSFMMAVFAAALPFSVQGQDKDAKPADKPADAPASPTPAPKEESSVTDHSIKIGSQTIPYKATASTILLKNEKDEPIALLYSTAYTRSDVKDFSQRFFFTQKTERLFVPWARQDLILVAHHDLRERPIAERR